MKLLLKGNKSLGDPLHYSAVPFFLFIIINFQIFFSTHAVQESSDYGRRDDVSVSE